MHDDDDWPGWLAEQPDDPRPLGPGCLLVLVVALLLWLLIIGGAVLLFP